MTNITRFEDWPRRLDEYIRTVSTRAFDWKEFNCCIFCNGAAEAITGIDFYSEFEGKYHDEETAAQALKTIGNGSLYQTLVKKFGRQISPAMAQRGDLVLIKKPLSIGVCMGQFSLFIGETLANGSIADEGLQSIPTLETDYAFKVGR